MDIGAAVARVACGEVPFVTGDSLPAEAGCNFRGSEVALAPAGTRAVGCVARNLPERYMAAGPDGCADVAQW